MKSDNVSSGKRRVGAICAKPKQGLAARAFERAARVAKGLEYLFLLGLEAGGTKIMRGFGHVLVWLEYHHETTEGQLCKIVTRGLILPFLTGFYGSFRIQQAIKKRRMRKLKIYQLAQKLRQQELDRDLLASLLFISKQADDVFETHKQIVAHTTRIARQCDNFANASHRQSKNHAHAPEWPDASVAPVPTPGNQRDLS